MKRTGLLPEAGVALYLLILVSVSIGSYTEETLTYYKGQARQDMQV